MVDISSEIVRRVNILSEIRHRMVDGVPVWIRPIWRDGRWLKQRILERDYDGLKDAVEKSALTTKEASDVVGVTPRQFQRLIKNDPFRDNSWSFVSIGGLVLYDRYIVEWFAKSRKVRPIRDILKRNDISNYRRNVLKKRLEKIKMEYRRRAPMNYSDYLTRNLPIDLWMLAEFGPDEESEWELLEFYKNTMTQDLSSNSPENEPENTFH